MTETGVVGSLCHLLASLDSNCWSLSSSPVCPLLGSLFSRVSASNAASFGYLVCRRRRLCVDGQLCWCMCISYALILAGGVLAVTAVQCSVRFIIDMFSSKPAGGKPADCLFRLDKRMLATSPRVVGMSRRLTTSWLYWYLTRSCSRRS